MGDNLRYNTPGSGDFVATDLITISGTGVHLQRMKLALGSDGVYKGDLDFGANIAASSIPVTIASDQSAIKTRINMGAKVTYMASASGIKTISTSAGSGDSIGFLWHPSASSKRASLQKALVTWTGNGSGDGTFKLLLTRITSDDGSGASGVPLKQDQDDPNPECIFRGNGSTVTRFGADAITMLFKANADGQVELTDILEGKGLICRASQAEGWEIRTVVNETITVAAPKMALSVTWTEE